MPPLKAELHHWWPQSLSRFWADDDGCTHQLSCDGTLVRSPPGNFGASKNTHHIKLSSVPTVWDQSFERDFGPADTRFPALVDWLRGLDAGKAAIDRDFVERLEARSAPEDMLDALAEGLVSLIVRSPRFRNGIRLTVKHYVGAEANKPLVAINMLHCQAMFSKALRGRGKFVVLRSDTREFIFGDGFLQNFVSSAAPPISPMCLVPLTPEITILYARPMAYDPLPRLMVMRVTPEEAGFLNDTVQIYSQDFLYFRRERPTISEHFSGNEFREYELPGHPWIQRLVDVAASNLFRRSRSEALSSTPMGTSPATSRS